jgi:hypothetical protein
MKRFLIHFVVLVLVLLTTNLLFNHVNVWIAYVVPILYLYFFNNLKTKINETFF